MKYQIVVRYEKENFRSVVKSCTEEESGEVIKVLEAALSAGHFGFSTEGGGWVIFPKYVLESSIISLELVE